MGHHLLRDGVEEAVPIDGATASEGAGQELQTLVAEPNPTITAEHFMALRFLRVLILEVVFRDTYLASRALLGARFAHPLAKLHLVTFGLGRP